MATGTDAGGLWDTNAGNKTVTATPAVGDLIVVVHGMSGWANPDESIITDNNSGGGGTYTRLGTAAAPLAAGGGTTFGLWVSVRDALITSASSTVFTATNTGDTGGGLTVLRFSGMHRVGSAAVRQSIGQNNQTENPPVVAFSAATLTTNPVILACGGEDNPLAITQPAGFTEADDTGWNSPVSGIEVCWDDAGNTASSYAWTGGASTDHCEIAVELDASAAVWTGTGAPTVPMLTASGIGEIRHKGVGAANVPMLTASGTGKLRHKGTGAATLPILTATGVGHRTLRSTGAPTLPILTATGVGKIRHKGTGTATLPVLTASGTGKLGHKGTGSPSLPMLTASGVGGAIRTLRGVGACTLPMLAASGAARHMVLGGSAPGGGSARNMWGPFMTPGLS